MPCTTPSSPKGPCSTGNATSTPSSPPPGETLSARPSRRHTPSRPISTHTTSCPALEQAVAHGLSRGQRHVVLGGAPAGEHGHHEPPAGLEVRDVARAGHPAAGACSGGVGGVVVVVVVVVGVLVVPEPSMPTTIVTVVPLRACDAGRRRLFEHHADLRRFARRAKLHRGLQMRLLERGLRRHFGRADHVRDFHFLGRLRDRQFDLRSRLHRAARHRGLREHGAGGLRAGNLLGDRAHAQFVVRERRFGRFQRLPGHVGHVHRRGAAGDDQRDHAAFLRPPFRRAARWRSRAPLRPSSRLPSWSSSSSEPCAAAPRPVRL